MNEENYSKRWQESDGDAPGYQPKTGQACHCRRGQQRDNCPDCEGTGQRIDFKAIREKAKPRYSVMTKDGKIKRYVDQRYCVCDAYPTPHIHE